MESLSLFRLGYHSKEFVDHCNLASNISFVHPLQLPFPQHVHDLKTLQGSPCRLKRKEAHSRLRQAFDKTVILLDQVIEVFHLDRACLRGYASSNRQCFEEKALSGPGIPCWTQKELDRVPLRINSPVEVHPHFFNLNVGLIHFPGVIAHFKR
jgi:hypothetical protein